jgi:hypothetical protein
MTTEHEASRTLVKSPPELWAECSDAGSLARHLGEFGEITITRLEPETTVAWEGEHASGTVRIEPSGWGTRVTLTAQTRPQVTQAEPEAAEPPVAETEVAEAEAAETEAAEAEAVQAEAAQAEAAQAEAAQATIDQASGEEKEEAPSEAPIGRPHVEEAAAPVQEAPEDPDAALTSDASAFRIRWRRITGRMRGLFRSAEIEEAPASTAPSPPEESEPDSRATIEEPEADSAPTVEEPEADSAHAVEESEADSAPTVEAPEADARHAVEEPEADARPSGEERQGPRTPQGTQKPEVGSHPGAEASPDPEVVLTAALDSLGQAHHRPFSRA